MKKLLALLVVGGLLALTTGCPPASPTEAPKPNPTPTPTPTPGDKAGNWIGKVTKSDAGKITIKTEKGDKDFTVEDKVVKIDGKEDKAANIKVDSTATITTDKDGKVTAAAVTTNVNPDLSSKVTGKVTKSEGGKITIKPDTGDAKEFTISDDKVVKIDGKEDKAANIKVDSIATVTTDKDGKISAVDVKPAAPPPPPVEAPKPVTGKLTKIEGADITVDTKKYTIPDGAKLTVDGDTKKVADIKDLKLDDKTMATVTWDKDSKVTNVDIKTK